MSNRATRITADVAELADELAQADQLIAEQQARIERLERQIVILQDRVNAGEAA